MPPSSKVEATSWGKIRPGALRYPALAPPPLFALIPGAERNPLGAIRRELLGPHGDERAVLPLEHVVLHARVGVLAGLVKLHAPAVDTGPDRQVERHDRGAELVEVVGLGGVEYQLQNPETAARELVPARQHVRAGV